MLTHPLRRLWQSHLDRLRPARRRGPRALLRRRALHLRLLTPLERVESERAAALAALTSAAHGASLCTLDRERLPAAKYHEGAVAALGDAARALRRGGDVPTPEAWSITWDGLAERDLAWRAYLAGGREALGRVR